MEYQFSSDFITGEPRASFSYGHEAMGHWLELEIGSDVTILNELICQLELCVKNNQSIEWQGKEFILTVNDGDVEINANASFDESDIPDILSDDIDQFCEEVNAVCGIEDFLSMLLSYRQFI